MARTTERNVALNELNIRGFVFNTTIKLTKVETEFINLKEVETLAKESADKELKDQIKDLEAENKQTKQLIKTLRDNVDTVQDRVDVKDRQLSKLKIEYFEDLTDKKDSYNRNIKLLEKAQKEDVKEKEKKVTKISRIKELKSKPTKEIAEIISKEFDCKCSEGYIKSSLEYIKSKEK